MPDLANLYIKVDSRGVVTASKDLNKLTDDSRKTETATESVTAGFGKLKAAVIALGGAYAALKVAQYIKEATMLAARYETLGVVMRVVGNNAGYSGKQMEEFSQGLQRTGISMIASRTVLTRMVQAQLDLAQSSKLARIAQDAAVIGNINSSEAFERMIYGIQSAQTEMLRTIGINVNFENSYQAVATATGRVSTSFTEAEKAQIRLNVVMKAGEGITGAYEASMETAGKKVLSLERHIENLKVMLGAAFTPALAEIITAITESITDLNGNLSGEGKAAIEEWGNTLRLVIIQIEIELQGLLQGFNQVSIAYSALGLLYAGPGALLGKIPGLGSFASHFDFFAGVMASAIDAYEEHGRVIAALGKKYKELVIAMTPAGKLAAKQAEDALEKIRLEAVELAKKGKAAEAATKEQLKIQTDFAKAYKKSLLTTQEFELDSLKIQVDAFRKAKVDEVQLEEWMQNELKNIKLRAQNEALALYEELAQNNDFYAQKAIDTMSDILDAEEQKWAKILQSDDDAHRLRIQREEEYRDKILGTIDDITDARIEASQQIASGGAAPGAVTAGSTSSPSRLGGTYDVIMGVVFVNNRAGAQAYAQQIQDIADSAAQIAAAAAGETARAAQQTAEEAARKLQDIADQRVELEIQILEATGYAVEAVGIRRMQELAAMDESLRPLQQRLYYLEDEAEAAEAAAEATRELTRAQDASLRTWENSIATLVSQGRAIRDFINSLGATGVSMSVSAARGAYMADLAGAQAGDVESYNRITQSARGYISAAGQTAGSSVEMARIVAGIKGALSALQPVVDLESNIELLKAIKAATEGTATATGNLDLLGIKAIFDVKMTVNAILAAKIPDDAKALALNTTNAILATVNAILDTEIPDDAKALALNTTNAILATVDAVLKAKIPDDAKVLALNTTNAILATVDAVLKAKIPDDAKALALNTTNAILTTVTASLATGNTQAMQLATKSINKFVTTVSAALATDDATEQLKALLTGGGDVTTTVDGTMTWNPKDPMKSIWEAIQTQTTLTAQNTGRYATVGIQETLYVTKDVTWSLYSGAGTLMSATTSKVNFADAAEAAMMIAALRPQFAEGGIATGPESGYAATLHGTELVVSPSTSYPATVKGGDNVILLDEVRALRAEIKAGNYQIAKNTGKTAKILTDFDYDGMPAERTTV